MRKPLDVLGQIKWSSNSFQLMQKMPKGKLQLFMIIMNAYSSEKEK